MSYYPTKADLKNETGADTLDFAKNLAKNLYNAKIISNEDKLSHITNLATNTTLNAKIDENGTLSITNLATNTALTAFENKIPNVNNLVKKTDFNKKINKIENKITTDHDHNKYIVTQKFSKLPSENVSARLAQTILESKNDIANFVKKDKF